MSSEPGASLPSGVDRRDLHITRLAERRSGHQLTAHPRGAAGPTRRALSDPRGGLAAVSAARRGGPTTSPEVAGRSLRATSDALLASGRERVGQTQRERAPHTTRAVRAVVRAVQMRAGMLGA